MHIDPEHFRETTPPMTWRAIYENKKVLNQYNKDGSKNSYNDIKRKGLRQFQLLDQYGRVVVVIHLDSRKKLIWRMRVALHLHKKTRERIHLVGWQERRRGVNMQMICAVFPGSHIEIIDRFREDHPWFYPVIFREAEKL